MSPFRRETAQQLREKLEKWRHETGRDAKPDKPWLPLRRRTMGPIASNLMLSSCKPSITSSNKKAPVEPRTKNMLSTSREAIQAKRPLIPAKRAKLVGKENKASNESKMLDPLPEKSRRERLEDWKKAREALLAETKKRQASDKSTKRRQTISSSSVGTTLAPGNKKLALPLPLSKINFRRQTMVVSSRMSPLLEKANAKDISLNSNKEIKSNSTICKHPVATFSKASVLQNDITARVQNDSGSSKATVGLRKPVVHVKPVNRLSISTMHRAHNKVKNKATTFNLRQPAVNSSKVMTGTDHLKAHPANVAMHLKQASHTFLKKPISKMHPNAKVEAAFVKQRTSGPGIKNPKDTSINNIVAITPAIKGRSSLAVRKSVKFQVSPGIKATPQNSPSLRSRLEYWLAARGKTPSRFRHLHCFGMELSTAKQKRMPSSCTPGISGNKISMPDCNPQCVGASPELIQPNINTSSENNNLTECFEPCSTQFSTLLEEDDENVEASPEVADEDKKISDIAKAVKLAKLNNALDDLLELHERNYPVQGISDWLDEMYLTDPDVQTLSAYWICRAKMSERSGHPSEVVSLLNRGISMGAQPFEPLLNLREKQTRFSKIKKHMDESNILKSTEIHYAIMNKPPAYCRTFKELDAKSPDMAYVTPVRRSIRLSHTNINDLVSSGEVSFSTPFKPSSSRKRSIEVVKSIEKWPKCYYGRRSLFFLANPALTEETLK